MQWVPLGEWGVQNTLIAELAFNSEVVGGLAGWSSLRGSIDMLQHMNLRTLYAAMRLSLPTEAIIPIYASLKEDIPIQKQKCQ